jgi:hypothetical protein
MLDEEVEFTQKWNCPKNKTADSILWLGDMAIVLGGATAGYWGAKHGLDLGTCAGIGFGTMGLLVGAGIATKIDSSVKSVQESFYRNRQMRLDQIAKARGAETAEFDYRGNVVECVLRPQYKNDGHIFYMNTNDPLVSRPTFSYQPNRPQPLKFRFETPLFEKETQIDSLELTWVRLNAISAGKDARRAVKDYISRERNMNRDTRFTKSLAQIVSDCNKKLDNNQREKMTCLATEDRKRVYVLLEYSGENYDMRLKTFSRCASDLINSTYRIRAGRE